MFVAKFYTKEGLVAIFHTNINTALNNTVRSKKFMQERLIGCYIGKSSIAKNT